MYKVIIVEDDPMVSSINKQYIDLNKDLYVDAVFTNGKDALKYLENNDADLAILDMYMPVMNGMDLLMELRKKNIKTNVIMVTAANDSKQIRDILSYGVIDYLIKPFTYERFNDAILKFVSHMEILKSDLLSQAQINSLLSGTNAVPKNNELLMKGLQEKTLNTIVEYMMKHKNEAMTSEKIAEQVQLSRVTVRRYMSYLLKTQEIISDIDYSTGGRPSIIYRYIK